MAGRHKGKSRGCDANMQHLPQIDLQHPKGKDHIDDKKMMTGPSQPKHPARQEVDPQDGALERSIR